MLPKVISKVVAFPARAYLNYVTRWEWLHSTDLEINERIIEYGFALNHILRMYPRTVLDVGSGKTAFPSVLAGCGFRVTAIDNQAEYWGGDFFNRHYYIIRDDITKSKLTGKFDVITCISTLEHIVGYREAVGGMFQLLNDNGCIIVTVPHNNEQYVSDVHELGYDTRKWSYICQVFSQRNVEEWAEENDGVIIEQEYYKVWSGRLWSSGERIKPPQKVASEEEHQLTCIVMGKAHQP